MDYALCFLAGYLWKRQKHDMLDEDEQNESVCLLKNALLTYHILKQRRHDFENSKLPFMAGCSFEHACFSYLIPRRIDRNTPFYTRMMEEKGDKIRKYLCEEFDDPIKAEMFFKKVVEEDMNNENNLFSREKKNC